MANAPHMPQPDSGLSTKESKIPARMEIATGRNVIAASTADAGEFDYPFDPKVARR